MTPLLLLLSACAGPSLGGGRLSWPDPTPTDTSAPAEDSDPAEGVPGVSDLGLCQLSLECPGEIPDEPGVDCAFTVADEDGQLRYAGPARVDVRGRSSSDFPKKQYGVELQDAQGQPLEVNLLGMGAESDWVLNGAWIDRALFRNALAYDLFRALGRYAPELRFCWLTLDGAPWGVYHLVERVKVDGARLALEEDPEGGSFLVKLDDEGGIWPNTYGNGEWQLQWPSQPTEAQKAGIKQHFKDWDGAVKRGDEVWEQLDREAALDLVLLEELLRNNDGYYLSLFLFRDQGAPAGWVPWDLDLTLGQPSYNDNENPAGFIAYRPGFIDAFNNDPAFAADLAARWATLREDTLSDEALQARMEGYVALLGAAAYENFEVWPIDEVSFGSWAGTNYLYEVQSYDEELARVYAWLPQRTAWLDAQLARW